MAREALDEAAQQSVRAGQIVRRLRDFITYGHTERKLERLPRLVAEANALALVGSREYGIEVDVELAAGADRVLVDRIQIQQVLLNLIRNAIEAMIDSPVRQLTISAVADGNGMIQISVADTGKGISPDTIGQIFQPFVTSKEQGMGIGLSICRTIIEAHGGRIWFEPGRASGTVFHFTIPEAEAISE
jgi:two-component system sensor kinase FixL